MPSIDRDSLEHVVAALARSHGLVVFVGAGVSAGPPARLPSWKPLNEAIVRVLSARVGSIGGRKGWYADVISVVASHRNDGRFPPEYQAQIIHEMCGERYFRALQALDIDVINDGHDAIAALAATGVVRAIVTTNFDRLIERALERRGIAYSAAIDETSFIGAPAALPVIKIHGCVSKHLSMIDTLKQRRLGRSAALQSRLDSLHGHAWMYVGFSAADLEGDASYLGLVEGARRAPGAVYVAWPGNPPKPEPRLSRGATLLMDAYRERGFVIASEVAEFVDGVSMTLGASRSHDSASSGSNGSHQVEAALMRWASELTPASAALCLASVLEAVAEAEAGVRVLDRFVRHELIGIDREGPDYRALQFHYGRMGAALGRFVEVRDLNGAESNASVETVQSLYRLERSELAFGARAQLSCVRLWMGDGAEAQTLARDVVRAGVKRGYWGPEHLRDSLPPLDAPRSVEDAIDGWLYVAKVAVVVLDPNLWEVVDATAEAVIERARSAGDPVRSARAAALYLLALSEASSDVPATSATFDADFREAERVGDGFACGLRALALGRWWVGTGGLERVTSGAIEASNAANHALAFLATAERALAAQGMDPWIVYAWIQRAKAFADLHRWDDAQDAMNAVTRADDRFPIFRSIAHEAVGQILTMRGAHDEANRSFLRAFESATESGLHARAQRFARRLGLMPDEE